jgi:hypothetical protein
MNALSATILVVLLLVVLLGSRHAAILAMAAGVIFLAQVGIDVVGINVYPQRFLEFAGFVRVIVRKEFSFSQLCRMDRTFLLLYGYTMVALLLRSGDMTTTEIVAPSVDAFFSYFTFRGLLTNMGDVRKFLRTFVFLLVPFVAMVVEQRVTRRNPFEAVGGNPKMSRREGGVRAQATFQHASLLGTFAASFLAFYIGLALSKADRKSGLAGMGLCLTIVWATNSGAPASCVMVGVAGWTLWIFRAQMRSVRRVMAALFVALALAMKAPIWYLLARVADITGGDGFHRARLMDMAFQDLGKWWFLGMSRRETARWFPYTLDSGVADLTNVYLLFGISGGLGALLVLIALLKFGYGSVGKALAILRSSGEAKRDEELFCWGLGVMLVIHTFNWLSITYFDQVNIIWFMQLAIVTSVTQSIITSEKDTGPRPNSPGLLTSRHAQIARFPLRPADQKAWR